MKLGDLIKDRLTGFTGVMVAETRWLNGCVRIVLHPTKLSKDGQPGLDHTFDANQCEVVKAEFFKTSEAENVKRPGGPMPDAVRR